MGLSGKIADSMLHRKRKRGKLRRRREKAHSQRLEALGIPADQIRQMTGKEKRQRLLKLSYKEQIIL
jgi:hypothetical protein